MFSLCSRHHNQCRHALTAPAYWYTYHIFQRYTHRNWSAYGTSRSRKAKKSKHWGWTDVPSARHTFLLQPPPVGECALPTSIPAYRHPLLLCGILKWFCRVTLAVFLLSLAFHYLSIYSQRDGTQRQNKYIGLMSVSSCWALPGAAQSAVLTTLQR